VAPAAPVLAGVGGERAPRLELAEIVRASAADYRRTKCQRVATERWLVARRRDVLPIPYFHVVFTLPHALNPLAQSHPRLIYRLLFQSAASTLSFAKTPSVAK